MKEKETVTVNDVTEKREVEHVVETEETENARAMNDLTNQMLEKNRIAIENQKKNLRVAIEAEARTLFFVNIFRIN